MPRPNSPIKRRDDADEQGYCGISGADSACRAAFRRRAQDEFTEITRGPITYLIDKGQSHAMVKRCDLDAAGDARYPFFHRRDAGKARTAQGLSGLR